MEEVQLKPTGRKTLSIGTFGVRQEQTEVSSIVSVSLCLRGYPNTLLSLYVIPTIREPISSQPITVSEESHKHLLKLDLADSADVNSQLPVDILGGCDYYLELVTGGICRGVQGLTDIHIKLSWVLSGPIQCTESVVQSTAYVVTTHLLQAYSRPVESLHLSEQLCSFRELESLCIHEDKTLYDELISHVSFQNGRYKVSLLWKDLHEALPDNYQLSAR